MSVQIYFRLVIVNKIIIFIKVAGEPNHTADFCVNIYSLVPGIIHTQPTQEFGFFNGWGRLEK